MSPSADKNMAAHNQSLVLVFLSTEKLIWPQFEIAVTLLNFLHLPKIIQKVNRGVLIERAQYYTILEEGVGTIREGVLFEKGALTEVVQYVRKIDSVYLYIL